MDRPNRTASMRMGRYDWMGPGWPRLSGLSPQPCWKTATSTPKDAAAASRFITAATAGISRLRKASRSSKNPRTTMTAMKRAVLGGDHGAAQLADEGAGGLGLGGGARDHGDQRGAV